MFEKMTLPEFLDANRIKKKDFDRSECDWDRLREIGIDHESQLETLGKSAEYFARMVQAFPGVHSVRWRVKDTQHVIEKIIRKCLENNEKYKAIEVSNYFTQITDLVGVRALHLFKDDCFEIDASVRRTFDVGEKPIAYVRAGDLPEQSKQYSDNGFEVLEHEKGYRSVHYLLVTKPSKRQLVAELQVRTIFEEGWSEIDHRVRYPNFSDNALVGYVIAIFNRLAGSADEMGGFVRSLTSHLVEYESHVKTVGEEKEASLAALDKALVELESEKKESAGSRQLVKKLRSEVDKLRAVPDFLNIGAGIDPSTFALGNSLKELKSIGIFSGTSIADILGSTPVKSVASGLYLDENGGIKVGQSAAEKLGSTIVLGNKTPKEK